MADRIESQAGRICVNELLQSTWCGDGDGKRLFFAKRLVFAELEWTPLEVSAKRRGDKPLKGRTLQCLENSLATSPLPASVLACLPSSLSHQDCRLGGQHGIKATHRQRSATRKAAALTTITLGLPFFLDGLASC